MPMKNYTISVPDVTPYTAQKLLDILVKNGIDTQWIEYIGSLTGITYLWVTRRCIELINEFDIELPNNIYGVTCNPISEGEY